MGLRKGCKPCSFQTFIASYMKLPATFISSLEGLEGFDQDAFEKVHASGDQITSIRINPLKSSSIINEDCFTGDPVHPSIGVKPIPWCGWGYYLEIRPSFTFDPLFHAGCYYVQEASSMFLEQALLQTSDLTKPLKVLDLAAAPGGKSTHIQSLISKDSLLVSNDVIRSRGNILKENIIKWGCSNVMVTNNDPRDFAKLENYFDVIVVDAPCSGSGLFRREPAAIEEWSLNNVQLCNQRQQRIIANVWPALKKDGVLVYSTCSYSSEENEEIISWMAGQLSGEICHLTFDTDWGIVPSGGGYRFWPDKVKGEGFFMACIRKKDGDKESIHKIKSKPLFATRNDEMIIKNWADTSASDFIKYKNTVYSWPSDLVNDFSLLLSNLGVIYSGTIIGEIVREKLVPDHAFALSSQVSKLIESKALNYGQAINYLKKNDLHLENSSKGWQLVSFNGHALGWINVLNNRINNYYPKHSRILKDL